MGEGRLYWSLRRPFFYGIIVLVVCLIRFNVTIPEIFDLAFARSGEFSLFHAYLFLSLPGLIVTIVFSQMYADTWGTDLPMPISILTFLFEDLVSPVYSIFQLIMGFIIEKAGGDVDWGGVIWDVIWTVICGGFIAWGLLTQIQFCTKNKQSCLSNLFYKASYFLIPNEDVYTILEEFLDIVIDHREHWESTTHKMFEAVKKDIGTGGIKEFIAALRKWTIRIDYDDEDQF